MDVDFLAFSDSKFKRMLRTRIMSINAFEEYKKINKLLINSGKERGIGLFYDNVLKSAKEFNSIVSTFSGRGSGYEYELKSIKLYFELNGIGKSSIGGSYAMSSSLLHNFLSEYVCKPSPQKCFNDYHNKLKVTSLVLKNIYTLDYYNSYFNGKSGLNRENFDINEGIMRDNLYKHCLEYSIYNRFYKDTVSFYNTTNDSFYDSIYYDNIKPSRMKALIYIYNGLRGFCNASITQIA